MAFGQQFSAYAAVLNQPVSFKLLRLHGALMVIELAHQKVAACNGAPAEKQIGKNLQCALPLYNTLSLMAGSGAVFVISGIGRRERFFDLEEQRIFFGPALSPRKNNIIADSHAARPHDLKPDVHGSIAVKQELAIWSKRLAIIAQS